MEVFRFKNRKYATVGVLLTIFFTRTTKLKQYYNNINVPNSDMAPHAAHMTKLRPIDPVLMRSPVGETKIPEPVYNYYKVL